MEKIKLLVVDDIPQTRKDITRLLYFEDDMVVIGEAGDGVEALKKISELQPDVVLMDINMPQMDGITATERVCNVYPHVAVVIISIQGESEYLKKAMVAGARDYLVKPLGSEEMAGTIRNAYKHQCLRMPKNKQINNSNARSEQQLPSKSERITEPRENLQQPYHSQRGWEPLHIPNQLPQEETYYSRHYNQQPEPNHRTGYAQDYPANRAEPLIEGNTAYEGHYSSREMYYQQQMMPLEKPYFQSHQQQQPAIPPQDYLRLTYEHTPNQITVQHTVPASQENAVQSTQTIVSTEQKTTEKPGEMPPQAAPVDVQVKDAKEKKEVPAVKEAPPQVALQSSPRLQQAQTEDKPLGQVSVVFCGKGGVGKTTIATNLAVVLAQQERKKVALIDYDLQFGDISVLLNLSDGKNISDLVQNADTFTDEIVNNYMIRHFTGIDILPAPLFPQDAEYISAEHTDQILRLLKKNYDYIIVDTAGTFNEINLQAFDLADQILLVTTRDIVTIKNTKTSLNILDSLNYRDKIRVVLNRSDQDLGVDIADLEKGLEITVAHQVTSDEKAAITAINKGVPVVVSHNNSEITKSFKRLCERMTNGRRHSAAEKQSRSIITRMFSL